MQRILIFGYFGARNFGDEALLADFLLRRGDWLTAQGLAIDVVTNEHDPLEGFLESSALAVLNITHVARKAALRVNPKRYRALIAPGGSLLQDATSLRSLLYYLFVIRRFCGAGVPVYMLNQGIGPLEAGLARWLTPRILSRVKLLTLRDETSHDWARGALSGGGEIALSADPVLFSSLTLPERSEQTAPEYALIIPRPVRAAEIEAVADADASALTSLAAHLSAASSLPPYFLPLHGERDLALCRSAAAHFPGAKVVDPAGARNWASTIWALIANAQVVVSFRLHGLIAAAAHGLPAFGVSYDPKVQAFCQEIGYPYCFPEEVRKRQTLESFSRLWIGRDEMRRQLEKNRNLLKERFTAAEARFDALW